MDYEALQAAEARRRSVGLDMHETNMVIHASRQAIQELRGQVPVDRAAISEHYSTQRQAHSRRHELDNALNAAKEAIRLAMHWPPGPDPWV